MKHGFGIYIGSSRTYLAYLDESGKLLDKWSVPTPIKEGSEQVLPLIADEVEKYMRSHGIFEDDVAGIGVGIPGPVNGSGTVNKCVNLGWGMFNIDRALSGLTGLPVAATNVANAAALGESWLGSAKGRKNVFFMAVNTGVGGCILMDGKLAAGAHGGAGEVGHMVINRQETETCTCGKRGCVEQYISPFGIVRLAKRRMAAVRTASSLRQKRELNYEDVIHAAKKGDKLAQEVLEEVYAYAGEMIANVCAVTNPDTVILGGELCKWDKPMLDGISRSFRKAVFHANKEVRFEVATLGLDAPLYGAFKLVLDQL